MMMKHGSILLLGLVLMASCSKDTNDDAITYEDADIPVQQQLMGVFEGEWFYGDYAPAKGTIKEDGNLHFLLDFPCEMVFGNILDGMRRNYLLHPEEGKQTPIPSGIFLPLQPIRIVIQSRPSRTR